MPHFTIKRLPAGFTFPLGERSIKEGLCDYLELFHKIEISGISFSERSPTAAWLRRYWVGILTASRHDGWGFELHVNGLRNENLAPYKEHVQAILIQDMRNFIAEKIGAPETSPLEPRQLFLAYSTREGLLKSCSHKVLKDK